MTPPPSNSSWDTPCSLLIRPCCPLPPFLACPVGRSVVNSARWTFLVAKTEVVIFHLLSCPPFVLPSLRVASSPLGMSRQTCAIIPARAWRGAVRPSVSLSQVARICVRIVFRSCRWDLHLVTESRIRCTDRTMSTCPSLPLAQAGKVRRMLTISTRVD